MDTRNMGEGDKVCKDNCYLMEIEIEQQEEFDCADDSLADGSRRSMW